MTMSWPHPDFHSHNFAVGNEVYDASAYTMPLSPIALPASAAASMSLQQHDAAYRNDYTPRFQPNPFDQPFPHQQYNTFGSYTCSTSPSTSRGRSSSGDTASYITSSTISLPTPPQEETYLSGVSSHYQLQSSHQICPTSVSPTAEQLPRKISIKDSGEAEATSKAQAKSSPKIRNIEGSPSIDSEK